MQKIDEWGYDNRALLADEAEARERLGKILADRIMLFNPYRVGDRELVDCAMRGRWSPWPSLTQMVVLHFGKIKYRVSGVDPQSIQCRIGNSDTVFEMEAWRLLNKVTYLANRRSLSTQVNGRNLTNLKMLEVLQDHSFFVSHMLRCRTRGGGSASAYRMFRMEGSVSRQAAVIRRRMCEAKIVMLEEVMAHPYAEEYLHCRSSLFDFRSIIQRAIESVRNFPESAISGKPIK